MSEQKSRCPGCEPAAQDHVHPAMGAQFAQPDLGPDHCSVCHHLECPGDRPSCSGASEAPQGTVSGSPDPVADLQPTKTPWDDTPEGKRWRLEGLVRAMTGLDHAARILSSLPERSPDRRVLVVLRGLPGSGKSTVAQAIVDSDPGRWARVSKDDVRQMMVGPSGDLFRFVEDLQREAIVGRTIRAAVSESLAAGLDVVVDATNLTEKALEVWVAEAARFAVFHKRTVAIAERAVPTPVEECVARDARRGARSVGRAVIERLAATIDIPLADRNQEVGQ